MITKQRFIEVCNEGDDRRLMSLAEDVLRSWSSAHLALDDALEDPAVRRWVRIYLLARMSDDDASDLAARLLGWPSDLSAERRDQSTSVIVKSLAEGEFQAHLPTLAASNAASAVWDRLAGSGEQAVFDAVRLIFEQGDSRARETTLHLLVLDPYGPQYLTHERQDEILVKALDDPDPEIRGLAAEVIAADLPAHLLDRWEVAPTDSGERVRMAFWQTALVHRPDEAIEHAGSFVLDPAKPHEARRTALLALTANVSTRTVSPVLRALLTGDDQVLAEDAAQLMWRHHRAPDIADAASRSQFEPVQKLANRLLHPEMGSPAAGGSRPGDPTRTTEIFEQIQPRDNKSGG
jgi:hypothetical protein